MGCVQATKGKTVRNGSETKDDSQPPTNTNLIVGNQSSPQKEVVVAKDQVNIDRVEREINVFSFEQIVTATKDFRSSNLVGRGGFGKVYKGQLDTGQIVAVKQLDPTSMQGIVELAVEVATLSRANHPNLVNLIGYCSQGPQRLLVYEYMPLGSLDHHLHEDLAKRKNLDWNIRMKIAAGAARGLQYLHDEMNPPIIYRDVKSSNILLGEGYHPKLSDFGLAKVGPKGDKTPVSTRLMGTRGYCAPEYIATGRLTFSSDIYSFGVVLLEILTGRKAVDSTNPGERNLVKWARTLFNHRTNYPQMADPLLQGQYPRRGLQQAMVIASECVLEQPDLRPPVARIVSALDYLAAQTYNPRAQSSQGSQGTASSSRSN